MAELRELSFKIWLFLLLKEFLFKLLRFILVLGTPRNTQLAIFVAAKHKKTALICQRQGVKGTTGDLIYVLF